MHRSYDKVLYVIVVFIIIFGIAITAIGVFYTSGGTAYEVTNQYGDLVKIYGDGIYSHDSYFKAPIFRGTDFTILFIAVPLLLVALLMDMKKNSLRWRLFLTSVISVFTYYSTSISFGITYNFLHLLYIAFFSVSFFGLIISIMSIDSVEVEKSIELTLPYKGINVFLVLTGIALIIAWLPDIITALVANRPLELIEVYTTEITYVLDMGIIGPVALICLFLLKKRDGLGYVLLQMLLILCCMIGIMLPIQTAFQLSAGIELPLEVIITKVGIFVALALFALYYNIRFMKAVSDI